MLLRRVRVTDRMRDEERYLDLTSSRNGRDHPSVKERWLKIVKITHSLNEL